MSLDDIFKDVYMANRLMVDLDQESIDLLERNPDYRTAFTPTLQRHLYLTRLRNLGVNTEQINQLSEIQKETNISWKNIYVIATISMNRDKFTKDLLIKQILANNDLPALKIVLTLSDFVLNSKYTKFLDENRSKNVLLYLLQKGKIENARLLFTISEIVGSFNDTEYLQKFMTAINNLNLPRFTNMNLTTLLTTIYGSLLAGAVPTGADKTIKFLADVGHRFSGEDMAYIARVPEFTYLVPYLLERGSAPVDEEFYLEEFGQEYRP
ncbi:MAG: hypothetical protein Solivirus2_14 [Solivirus sp.]|uniref:Uncharacterized protein n=1 Tax=Solivirus sp. TaxID=2487772 RepID=A0A3G5AJD3_9VIRU|nr:MAG: hypothetical protein Solivirus2_14 [Solivirus sp.]